MTKKALAAERINIASQQFVKFANPFKCIDVFNSK